MHNRKQRDMGNSSKVVKRAPIMDGSIPTNNLTARADNTDHGLEQQHHRSKACGNCAASSPLKMPSWHFSTLAKCKASFARLAPKSIRSYKFVRNGCLAPSIPGQSVRPAPPRDGTCTRGLLRTSVLELTIHIGSLIGSVAASTKKARAWLKPGWLNDEDGLRARPWRSWRL